MKTYKVSCNSCSALAINGTPCHETGCSDSFTFKWRGKLYAKYLVYSLDVWGNARDGFEVNDRSQCATIMLPENSSDKRLIQELKRHKLLNIKSHFDSFTTDGDDKHIMLDAAKTREPIFQLERV